MAPNTRRTRRKKNNQGEKEVDIETDSNNIKDKIKIFYTNCDSLMNKKEEFEAILGMYKPHVAIVTEVLHKRRKLDVQKSEIQVKGYKLFTNIEEKRHRGIAIYVDDKVIASEITIDNIHIDSLYVELKIQKRNMIIGGVYRSPNSTEEQDQQICSNMENVCNKNKKDVLIVGDYNCPTIDWENYSTKIKKKNSMSNKLIDTIRNCFLHQIINKNTRFRRGQLPNILDLVLTYEEEKISDLEIESPLGKSDHCKIFLSYDAVPRNVEREKEKRLYYEGDYEKIKEKIKDINWKEKLKDKEVTEQYKIFEEVIKKAIDEYIPIKKNVHNNTNRIQLPKDIIKCIKKKQNCWNKYMKDGRECS